MNDQKNKKPQSQLDLLMEFFKKNPNKDISHPEIVDWATNEWQKRTGSVFRDPDRGIRRLHQDGYLRKVKKGVYHYDPEAVVEKNLEDFTAEQKRAILVRDEYKCVMCGKGKKEGVELHIDHIKPKDLGGQAVLENGQTLCAQHNYIKKNLNQTETCKKMFIRLYELAKRDNNTVIKDFCTDVLQTYEAHDINGHINWTK